MKTDFKAELGAGDSIAEHSLDVRIILGLKPSDTILGIYGKTTLRTTNVTGWLSCEDLELLAVNILKALKSKRLKMKGEGE